MTESRFGLYSLFGQSECPICDRALAPIHLDFIIIGQYLYCKLTK